MNFDDLLGGVNSEIPDRDELDDLLEKASEEAPELPEGRR